MSQSVAVWTLVLVALLAANLPFLTDRLFVVWTPSRPKTLGLRLLEVLVLYGLTGLLAWLLERRLGRVADQGWEFFAITAALFLTLAFPGFVYRYLMRHGR